MQFSWVSPNVILASKSLFIVLSLSLFFFFWLCHLAFKTLVHNQGSDLGPLPWKYKILTTHQTSREVSVNLSFIKGGLSHRT